jgi:hypothetical protein
VATLWLTDTYRGQSPKAPVDLAFHAARPTSIEVAGHCAGCSLPGRTGAFDL